MSTLRLSGLCVAGVLAASACSSGGNGGGGSTTPVPPRVTGVDWRPSVEGNSINGLTWTWLGWVAVGSSGMVLTSPDGLSWTNHHTPAGSLNAVAWSGSRLVAVGGDNIWGVSGTILTSTDAIDWIDVSQGVPLPTLTSVVWSGDRFVAVGWDGTILTSPDGLQWTFRDSGTTTFLLGVAWSGSTFVSVGWTVLTSPDGVNWTERRGGVPDTISLRSVVWTGSQFVAVGQFGMVLTSPDGVTWASQTLDQNVTLTGVAWSGTNLVAVGDEVYTSPDGVAWSLRIGASPSLNGVAWSGQEYVAVGYYGSIRASTDGSSWDARVAPPSNTLRGLAWSGATFVAVGDWGTILTSADGESWTSRISGTHQWLSAVIWTGGRFLVASAGWDGLNQTIPVVLSSPDGVTWSSTATDPTAYSLSAIARADALSEFVAVGGYGTLLTSPDGTAWTPRPTTATCGLTGVATRGTRVVSVGWCNTVMSSDDGIAWTAQGGGAVGDAFFSVVASPSEFVVVGTSTTAAVPVVTLTSPDGITWTRRTPQIGNALNAVNWIGGRFVAVGRTNSIATSLDGVTWNPQVGAVGPSDSPPPGDLYAVAGDNNRLVAVGVQGTIVTSP